MTGQDLGITQKTFELFLKTFESFPQIEEVIVFGSRAIGNFRTGSDIDIVIKGEKVTLRLALEVNAILNEHLPIPYFVDVLSLTQITTPELIEHISRVGKVIYIRKSLVSSRYS
jgi:predicted nucleotidyltransferase